MLIQSLETLCPHLNHLHFPENEALSEDEKWCDIENDTQYNVAMPSFLSSHTERKGFQFEKFVQVGIPDYECLEKYLIENNPIEYQIDGRLVIHYEN